MITDLVHKEVMKHEGEVKEFLVRWATLEEKNTRGKNKYADEKAKEHSKW